MRRDHSLRAGGISCCHQCCHERAHLLRRQLPPQSPSNMYDRPGQTCTRRRWQVPRHCEQTMHSRNKLKPGQSWTGLQKVCQRQLFTWTLSPYPPTLLQQHSHHWCRTRDQDSLQNTFTHVPLTPSAVVNILTASTTPAPRVCRDWASNQIAELWMVGVTWDLQRLFKNL